MPKKQKGFRKEVIMPIFIVVIMVMSVFGFMWGSGKTKLNYNGAKFYQLDTGSFLLKINNYNAAFSYYPSELELLEMPAGASALFSTPMFYTTSEYNSTFKETIEQVKFNIAEIMGETLEIYVENAYTAETEYDTSVITCADPRPAVHERPPQAGDVHGL